jgi:hypothetical protein
VRRSTALLAAAVALGLAAPAAAAPPGAGVLVPGRSLGGVRLGATKAEVEAAWGQAYGRCRSCAEETWYFNDYAFRQQGAGVSFRHGRVSALFTLWQPAGWHTTRGLTLGESVARVTSVFGPLPRRECGSYYLLELPRSGAVTSFVIVNEYLFGFLLRLRGEPACL